MRSSSPCASFACVRAGELRAAELAAELSEARLRQLTAQIEPHFLFNSLNAISNRMHEDVEAADRMMSQLGNLLRAGYESDRSVLVALGRELEWLRDYTAMMAERFRGQLAYELDVDPGLEAVQVPRLLLQPIVENALEHGLADGRGSLRVEVRRRGPRLEYRIMDDGVGLAGGRRRGAPVSRTWRADSSCCFRVITRSIVRARAARRRGHSELPAGRMTYSVVIVEDEPPARAKLKRFLEELPDFRVVAEAASVDEGIAAVTRAAGRLVSGHPAWLTQRLRRRRRSARRRGAARSCSRPRIPNTPCAHSTFTRSTICEAVRPRAVPREHPANARRTRAAGLERRRGARAAAARTVAGPAGGREANPLARGRPCVLLATEDIERVSAAGNYVEVHARGKAHLLRESLTSFIAQLDPGEFPRVHRSHVVHVRFIAELRPMFHGDYELVLRDGRTLPLSRRYKALLPEAIRERL